MMRRRRLWVGLAATLLFCFLLVRGLDPNQVRQAWQTADYRWVAPALVAFFAGVWFRALRWRVILASTVEVPTRRLWGFLAIGYLANNVLPARLGDLARAYLVGRETGVSKALVLGTVFVERLADVFALLVLILLAALLVPLEDWFVQILRAGAGLFVLGFLAVIVLSLSRRRTLVLLAIALRVVPPRFHQPALKLADSFLNGLASVRGAHQVLGVAVLSLAAWLAEATMYWIMLIAFQQSFPFSVAMLTTAVANLGLAVPSSPGGIGPFEFAAAETLKLFGATGEVATAYAVALHLVLLAPVNLLGLIYLWGWQISLRRLVESSARTATGEEVAPTQP
ncbi:MAG TPA: lysylphosphatidylglycerol synthase transmembrane domain-containing protein [Dehalococcoidia bacterium]|nr:lysylphosphatidylglycerol synthase transmembrane domain-containing protein [Dehalococcoidia bacterium]